jgi:ferredoxin
MGLFDNLKGAFANDDTLGARSNAGLTKEGTKRTITWIGPNGKEKKSTVVAGQRLRDIARGSGIPIVYDCTEGTCKTCEAQMGNGRVKVCVAKAIDRDITIKYGLRQQ